MPKILLVDDEQMNRDPLARRLTRRGHEVVLATNADQAVAMTRQERPDVVLMDIGLPGKNGYEATREIKADPTVSATPIRRWRRRSCRRRGRRGYRRRREL